MQIKFFLFIKNMKIDYLNFKKNIQKNTPQVYFDYLYRRISYPLSYLLYLLNITPNAIALSQTILYIISAIIIISTHNIILGLAGFMVSYLLDFCDGNVARVVLSFGKIQKDKLRRGIMLENFNTNIAFICLYLSLGFFLFDKLGYPPILFLAAFAIVVKLVDRYTRLHRYLYDLQHRNQDKNYFHEKKPIMEKFKNSFLFRIKFTVSKSLFSGNFYYTLFLISFLLGMDLFYFLFIIYTLGEIIWGITMTVRSFMKK